jgi:hypothetical protein
LVKTRPVRDAQQTKQCVYNIPFDCGWCYIGDTSRPLEVRIKQHKYNLTQGLLEKSKLAQPAYEEGHKICWKEAKVLQIEPNATYRKYKESAHMSVVYHSISQLSLDFSPISNPVTTSQKTIIPSSVDYLWRLLCWYHTENFLFSDGSCSDSTLMLTTISVKRCMARGARPRVCGVLLNVSNVCLNSRWWSWFVLVLCPEIGTSSIDWANWRRRQSSHRNAVGFKWQEDDGNVQKHNNCINIPSAQTFK